MKTYDPYEELQRPITGFFSGLPTAAPGTVLVVDREGHPLRTLQAHSDRLTPGEVRFGRIRTLYRVNVREHSLEFSQTFPCRDDVGGFQANVRLICRVEEPESVVRRGIHDVSAVLVPAISETLKRVCRRHEAEQHAEAEEAALAAVREVETTTRHDRAFRITQVSLDLQLDRAAAEFVRQLKADWRTSTTQASQARLATERAEQEARLARERDRLEAQREQQAAAFEEERLAIKRARQKIEAELEAERLELALKRDELEAQRKHLQLEAQLSAEKLQLDYYLAALNQGQYGAFALRLLKDPSSVEQVAVLLTRQRDAETSQRLEALRLLLNSDAVEGWEISDKAKVVLGQLLDSLSRNGSPQVIAGLSDHVPQVLASPTGSDEEITVPAEPEPTTVTVADGPGETSSADATSDSPSS